MKNIYLSSVVKYYHMFIEFKINLKIVKYDSLIIIIKINQSTYLDGFSLSIIKFNPLFLELFFVRGKSYFLSSWNFSMIIL